MGEGVECYLFCPKRAEANFVLFMSPLCYGFPLFCMSILLIAGTFEEPGVAADTDMPIAISPTTHVTPVSAVPTVSVYAIPTTPIPTISTVPTLTGPGLFY